MNYSFLKMNLNLKQVKAKSKDSHQSLWCNLSESQQMRLYGGFKGAIRIKLKPFDYNPTIQD
ncbi:MAG: hypothetical protein ACLFT0_14305 [Spirulinaceae cyanobacterium]